jgi:hypothetical protein
MKKSLYRQHPLRNQLLSQVQLKRRLLRRKQLPRVKVRPNNRLKKPKALKKLHQNVRKLVLPCIAVTDVSSENRMTDTTKSVKSGNLDDDQMSLESVKQQEPVKE